MVMWQNSRIHNMQRAKISSQGFILKAAIWLDGTVLMLLTLPGLNTNVAVGK